MSSYWQFSTSAPRRNNTGRPGGQVEGLYFTAWAPGGVSYAPVLSNPAGANAAVSDTVLSEDCAAFFRAARAFNLFAAFCLLTDTCAAGPSILPRHSTKTRERRFGSRRYGLAGKIKAHVWKARQAAVGCFWYLEGHYWALFSTSQVASSRNNSKQPGREVERALK